MILKRLLFGLITLYGLLAMNVANASYTVKFNGLGENLKNKLVGLHFKGGGNDFGGMFFVTELKDISDYPVNITLQGSSDSRINCKKQIRGYYWNSLRGGIIYPLDKQTLNYWTGVDSSYYNGLTMNGGFYTACSGNINSIYGEIKYSGTNITNYTIQAGRKYDTNINTVTGTNFAENFQIYKSKGIIGLIVDSNYGVAFVGGKVISGWNNLVSSLNNSSINNVITSITKSNINNNIAGVSIKAVYSLLVQTTIGILGNFNIMGQKDHNVQQDVKLLQRQNNAVLGGQNIVNVSTAINRARKNTIKLCAGKWEDENGGTKILSSGAGKTICIKNGDVIITDDFTLNTTKPTTIIVKGKNTKVIFNTNQRQGKGYVNVFVDNGYVLFNNDINNILAIGKNGDLNGLAVTSGLVFKGNIITNGLIAGTDGTNITNYKHKLYIKGSLSSLNTIGENPSRLKYLSGDLLKTIYTAKTMELQDVFSWRCLDTGFGTDEVNCSSTGDMYSNNAIIIQKEQYKNPLLR